MSRLLEFPVPCLLAAYIGAAATQIDCKGRSRLGVYPLKARRYAVLLRLDKAETVVFGCQCPGHKIMRSDHSMQNFSVSFSHQRGTTVSLETNLSFERKKHLFHECFMVESKGEWVI